MREGIPEEEILRYSKEQQPCIVIMGTRGRSQKDVDLLGSVTAEVIERSRVPVLAIPENTPFNNFEYKRIMRIPILGHALFFYYIIIILLRTLYIRTITSINFNLITCSDK